MATHSSALAWRIPGTGHEARRSSQGASRAAPGKSGLHERGEGERVIVLESWVQAEGQETLGVGWGWRR